MDTKLKVLHIAPIINNQKDYVIENTNQEIKYFTIGGLSNSVRKLAEGQYENNMDVGIVTTRLSSKAVSKNIYWKSAAHKSILDLFLKDPYKEIEDVFGIPDIVHTHDIYEIKQLAFIYHAVKRKIKVYISPRGTLSPVAISNNKIKKLIYIHFLFSFFVRQIEGFVALNYGEEQVIRKKFKNKNIIIIGNGVDDNYQQFTRNIHNYKRKLREKIINIGFLGRFEIHIKGLDNLFNSYIEYQKQVKKINIKLTFIGEHTKKSIDSYNFFQDKITKLNDQSMVDFLPGKYNDEKWDELSKLDIFMHPSRSEGMPNAVLEAMSMGLPCMISPQTNMGEIIELANCGWVIDNDIDSLLYFFLEIENYNKQKLLDLGENGLKYSTKELSWKKVSEGGYY